MDNMGFIDVHAFLFIVLLYYFIEFIVLGIIDGVHQKLLMRGIFVIKSLFLGGAIISASQLPFYLIQVRLHLVVEFLVNFLILPTYGFDKGLGYGLMYIVECLFNVSIINLILNLRLNEIRNQLLFDDLRSHYLDLLFKVIYYPIMELLSKSSKTFLTYQGFHEIFEEFRIFFHIYRFLRLQFTVKGTYLTWVCDLCPEIVFDLLNSDYIQP